MNIGQLLVDILRIYNNIENIRGLYDICKKYGYIGTIDEFVYEIKKIFNDYNVDKDFKIGMRKELQVAGGRNNLPQRLAAGLLASLVGIPTGFSAKYNELLGGHKKSISSTNKKLRKNETTFEKFIYNSINKQDLKTYSYGLLGLSISGILLVLFLINYISRAKSLEEGLNAFIGVLTQKDNLSNQNLIDACNNLQPLIDAKLKKIGISKPDETSQLLASDNSNNPELSKVKQIQEKIRFLQKKETNTTYEEILKEIQNFLNHKTELLAKQQENTQNNQHEGMNGIDDYSGNEELISDLKKEVTTADVKKSADNNASSEKISEKKKIEQNNQKKDTIDEPEYDGIKKRWVKIVNNCELYDDSKPFLAQIIFDLKFHKDFEGWNYDENWTIDTGTDNRSRLTHWIVTKTKEEAFTICDKIKNGSQTPNRKFLGTDELTKRGLENYVESLTTNQQYELVKLGGKVDPIEIGKYENNPKTATINCQPQHFGTYSGKKI